jgi:hypothetical protein
MLPLPLSLMLSYSNLANLVSDAAQPALWSTLPLRTPLLVTLVNAMVLQHLAKSEDPTLTSMPPLVLLREPELSHHSL